MIKDWCGCSHPDFFSETFPIAKKEYRCFECGRKRIRPNNKYAKVVGKWEGDFQSFNICLRCHNAGVALRKKGACACYGEIIEDLREYNQLKRMIFYT